jgi:IS30 family transposase
MLATDLIHSGQLNGSNLWRFWRHRSNHGLKVVPSADLVKMLNSMDIEHRPEEVESRGAPGHWEGDAVVQGHSQSGLVTLSNAEAATFLWGAYASSQPNKQRER